eukprot:2176232-Alexandrium_andersonii.AAC.1
MWPGCSATGCRERLFDAPPRTAFFERGGAAAAAARRSGLRGSRRRRRRMAPPGALTACPSRMRPRTGLPGPLGRSGSEGWRRRLPGPRTGGPFRTRPVAARCAVLGSSPPSTCSSGARLSGSP